MRREKTLSLRSWALGVLSPSRHRSTPRPGCLTSGSIRRLAGSAIRIRQLPPLHELPVITNEDLERLREALAPWSRKPKPPRPTRGDTSPPPNSGTEERYRAYARAGLERATAELAALGKRGRPSELFRSVCALGWSVANGVIGEAEFTVAYVNACRDNLLLARDGLRAIEASIRSGLEKAANDPLPHLEDREPDRSSQAAETQEPDSRPDFVQRIVDAMPDLEEEVEQLAKLKILGLRPHTQG